MFPFKLILLSHLEDTTDARHSLRNCPPYGAKATLGDWMGASLLFHKVLQQVLATCRIHVKFRTNHLPSCLS